MSEPSHCSGCLRQEEIAALEAEIKALREVEQAVHRYLGALNSKDETTALAELRQRLEMAA